MHFFSKLGFVIGRKLTRIGRFLRGQSTTSAQIQTFARLKPGDVVYAEMPFSDAKLYEIPDGHRVRPYLVAKKNARSIWCYPASSKAPKDYWNFDVWESYHLEKSHNPTCYKGGNELRNQSDSYFNLTKPYKIKRNRVIGLFLKPRKVDLQNIERALIVLKNRGQKVQLLNMDFPLKKGDLLKFGSGLLYVSSGKNGEVMGHKVAENPTRTSTTKLSAWGKTYYTDLNTFIRVKPKHKKGLVGRVE